MKHTKRALERRRRRFSCVQGPPLSLPRLQGVGAALMTSEEHLYARDEGVAGVMRP